MTWAIVSDTVSPANIVRPVSISYSDHAECPDVGAPVHRLAFRLLRRHVGGRSQNHSRLRRRQTQRRRVRHRVGLRVFVHRLRQSEVEHLHFAVRSDLDIGGFQVAMNDAALVRGFQRFGRSASRSAMPLQRESVPARSARPASVRRPVPSPGRLASRSSSP